MNASIEDVTVIVQFDRLKRRLLLLLVRKEFCTFAPISSHEIRNPNMWCQPSGVEFYTISPLCQNFQKNSAPTGKFPINLTFLTNWIAFGEFFVRCGRNKSG